MGYIDKLFWLYFVSVLTCGSTYRCPKAAGLFPDPSSCARFYHCSNQVPHLKDCPASLHFNVNLQVCDWPDNAKCGLRKPDYRWKCPRHEGMFANPSDCGSFYHCAHGVAHLKACPASLNWHQKGQRCEWPHIADCGQKHDYDYYDNKETDYDDGSLTVIDPRRG